MKRGCDVRRSPNSEGKSKCRPGTLTRTRKVMPNVGEKSPPDNWLDLHAQSLDALVRGSAPARPSQPYPGDHPCEIAGCAANAPFGLAALPRRIWFCRKHFEELEEFLCPISPKLSTCSGSTNSDGTPKWRSTSGTPSASPASEETAKSPSTTPDKSPSSPGQLSLW